MDVVRQLRIIFDGWIIPWVPLGFPGLWGTNSENEDEAEDEKSCWSATQQVELPLKKFLNLLRQQAMQKDWFTMVIYESHTYLLQYISVYDKKQFFKPYLFI